MGDKFVTAEVNLEFLKSLKLTVLESKETTKNVDFLDYLDTLLEFKANISNSNKILNMSEIYNDFECNIFYPKVVSKKDGNGYTRMKNVNYSKRFRAFLFEKFGNEYLEHLENSAKEEKREAIDKAMQALSGRVCDKEVVSAILRNALARASEKQIFVRVMRSKALKEQKEAEI